MTVLILCATWVVAQAEAPPPAVESDPPAAPAAEPAAPEPAAPEPVAAETDPAAPPAPPEATPPSDADELSTPPARPSPPSLSRRTWSGVCADPAFADDPSCAQAPDVGAEAERPSVLQPRSMAAAAALGGVVGFGTGFYYAGDNLQGTIFVGVDTALWLGLTAAVVAMNQLVIRNDFRTFRSLARGERTFGKWENNYYALSWVSAGLLVCSHLYQLIAGPFAVRSTNRSLAGVTVIPIDGGATLRVALPLGID